VGRSGRIRKVLGIVYIEYGEVQTLDAGAASGGPRGIDRTGNGGDEFLGILLRRVWTRLAIAPERLGEDFPGPSPRPWLIVEGGGEERTGQAFGRGRSPKVSVFHGISST